MPDDLVHRRQRKQIALVDRGSGDIEIRAGADGTVRMSSACGSYRIEVSHRGVFVVSPKLTMNVSRTVVTIFVVHLLLSVAVGFILGYLFG